MARTLDPSARLLANHTLICALDEWRRDDPIRDDITLLGVEYRGAR